MKKSNIILELTQDIYNIGGEFSNLSDDFLSMNINKSTYDKQCYIIACKVAYLQGVVNTIKSQGYKFTRYEKEIELLNILEEELSNHINLKDIEILTETDMITLSELTTKYKNIADISDISEEVGF